MATIEDNQPSSNPLQLKVREIFAALRLPMDYDPKNGIPKGAYLAVEAILAAERKAGRDETHCKVNCGCFAYDQAFEKGREQVAFECYHAKHIADAEGYRRGLEEAVKILQYRLDQIRSGADLYAVPGHDMAKALEAELLSLLGMIREAGK